jgi:DNA polymerase
LAESLDPQRRHHYLAALGIEEWVPRSHPGDPAAPSSAPALKSVPAPAPVALDLRPVSTSARAGAWHQLSDDVTRCTRCELHKTRTRAVLGVGDPHAQWLVVGEAPGAEEDRQGEPFVGRAGQLLDAMLRAIGLARGSNVYIANILKSRPPGNRDPAPAEVAACLPYLERQIELIRPRLILAVGRIAMQNLLDTQTSLARMRGQVHQFGGLKTPLIVTYHPAYLLRKPEDKRKAWEDLKFARTVFARLT